MIGASGWLFKKKIKLYLIRWTTPVSRNKFSYQT